MRRSSAVVASFFISVSSAVGLPQSASGEPAGDAAGPGIRSNLSTEPEDEGTDSDDGTDDPGAARTEVGGVATALVRSHFARRAGVTSWSSDGATLIVRVVGVTAADRTWVTNNVDTQALFTVRVDATKIAVDELFELQARVEYKLGSSIDDIGWSVGLDLDWQAVYLTVNGDPATRTTTDQARVDSAIEQVTDEADQYAAEINYAQRTVDGARSGGGTLNEIFRTSSGGNEVEQTDYRDEQPMRGGKWLRTPDGGSCTAGFLLRHPSHGAWRVSMAGHCADGGDGNGETGGIVRAWDGSTVGSVRTNTFENGGTDIALFAVPSSATTAARVVISAGQYRNVTGKRSGDNLTHNDRQSFAGRGIWYYENTPNKCGSLKKLNVSFSDNGSKVSGLYCLERRTRGGDSGGPVYYPLGDSRADAAGSIVGSKKERRFTTTKWYACYHTINRIEGVTGYRVVS